MKQLVLVGYNDGVLGALDRVADRWSVVVLEEPDLWRAKGLAAKAERHRCLAGVRFCEYQQSTGYRDLAAELAGSDAVAPGLEYAVEAAADLAEWLDRAGAGTEAAAVLRDKLTLRRVTAAAGMPGPRAAEIHGPADIAAFARGGACVVKPAGRQASLGVVLLPAGGDVDEAWRRCTSADEGRQVAQRAMRWRYLVEERLYGPEFSTECLVAGGSVGFFNVTAKRTAAGPSPVELGHLVPAPDVVPAAWRDAAQQLVDAVGFGSGMLHAEWILTAEQGQVLVECAGRPPGDRIVDLIDLAYGGNLTADWVDLLAGARPQPPAPSRGAAIAFLAADGAGTVQRVDGVDEARSLAGVRDVNLVKQPGDLITAPASSWDRLGSVTAVAGSAVEAEVIARSAAGRILVTLTG